MNKKIQIFLLKKYYKKIKLHFDKEIDHIKVEYQEMRKADAFANIAISKKDKDDLKKIHAEQLKDAKDTERAKWEPLLEKEREEKKRLQKINDDWKELFAAVVQKDVQFNDITKEIENGTERAVKKMKDVLQIIDTMLSKSVGYNQSQINLNKKLTSIEEDV